MSETAEALEQTPPQVTDETQVTAEDLPRVPPVAISRVKLADYVSNRHSVTVPENVKPEQVLDQGYWQHVAALFKQGDELIIMDDRMHWRLHCLVLAQDRLWAHLAVIHHVDLRPFHGQEIPIEEKDYEINFAGTHHKYRVFYKGEVLKDGFASEALARQWARNHIMSRKRAPNVAQAE